MGLDIQKASLLKRISAGILDFILLIVLAAGFACLISLMCKFDAHYQELTSYFTKYEEEYGIEFKFIGSDDFNAMPEEDQKVYLENCQKAQDAFNEDPDALKAYTLVMSLTLVVVTFGILIAYLILEFLLPIILKNGQTIGKKCFGIAVMHTNSVKVSVTTMFIRTILGKYAVETMIPVLMILMVIFNIGSFYPLIVAGALIIIEIVTLIVTKTNSLIHDLLAKTVTVDLASQMIFATQKEMLEAKTAAQFNTEQAGYVPGSFSFDKTTDGEALKGGDAQKVVTERTDLIIEDDVEPSKTTQEDATAKDAPQTFADSGYVAPSVVVVDDDNSKGE